MKTLFLDTHYNDILVVLFNDGHVVDKCEVINKKNNSEFIFPSIVKVIDGVVLDEIIVVNGPGSFTGVRLGVTIAKTLAYTLNIPIKTITSLECMAVSSHHLKVAFDDGNGYYVGIFKDNYQDPIYKYVSTEVFNQEKENIKLNAEYDYNLIYDYVKNNKKEENPHGVKPIYVKKIGVEK